MTNILVLNRMQVTKPLVNTRYGKKLRKRCIQFQSQAFSQHSAAVKFAYMYMNFNLNFN